MSDFDVSFPSGDPDKYWWIGGDHPYSFPSEWDHDDDLQEPAHEDSAKMTDDASSADNPCVLELEELTRDLTEHIYELEDAAQRRDEELMRSATFNDALAERVASLCTFICTMWVEQAASRARVKILNLSLCIATTLIVGLVGLLLAMLTK